MVLLALIAERHVQSKLVHGGRLLPAPSGASDLWSTYLSTWHPSSVGSVTPAPPSLGVLAALSTIAFGKAWLVVDVIVLGVVPLAALSAFTAARALTSAVRVRIWVAIVYSLLPAVTGAIAGGRIDVAVVAIVLPQVLRVGVSAVSADTIGSGLRRGAGAGLLLALAVAFAPGLWVVALAGLVVGLGCMELDRHDSAATVRRLVAAIVILTVPVVVLVPWSLQLFAHPRLALLGSGLPEFYTSHGAPSGFSLALLRAGGPAQPPIWIGIPIVAAALLGLNRQSRVAIARGRVARHRRGRGGGVDAGGGGHRRAASQPSLAGHGPTRCRSGCAAGRAGRCGRCPTSASGAELWLAAARGGCAGSDRGRLDRDAGRELGGARGWQSVDVGEPASAPAVHSVGVGGDADLTTRLGADDRWPAGVLRAGPPTGRTAAW